MNVFAGDVCVCECLKARGWTLLGLLNLREQQQGMRRGLAKRHRIQATTH